jgi:AcrR family transcriptional regulator
LPKGFTEREKEMIRKRLIEQGYKQFSAYGLKKTNVEELAAAAKISKGAFYLFYDSKEALFMDVVELAEQRYRQELLSVIDRPGPSSRARLYAIFKQAFALMRSMPILQFSTGSDFELLFRKLPTERFQEHLASDQAFFADLVARSRDAGISIQAEPDEISRLLYPLVLASLHEEDLRLDELSGGVDSLLELIAAFCLGEVALQTVKDRHLT